MSSITLFLVSILILFKLIYSQNCAKHLESCDYDQCCGKMFCKHNGVYYFCSNAACTANDKTCKVEGDGCCKGLEKNIFPLETG